MSQRATINDRLWFCGLPTKDRDAPCFTILAVVLDDWGTAAVTFSICTPMHGIRSWDEICMVCERISGAIWCVVGEYGVISDKSA